MAVDPLFSTSGLKAVSARAGACVCDNETRKCTESPWKVSLATFHALRRLMMRLAPMDRNAAREGCDKRQEEDLRKRFSLLFWTVFGIALRLVLSVSGFVALSRAVIIRH